VINALASSVGLALAADRRWHESRVNMLQAGLRDCMAEKTFQSRCVVILTIECCLFKRCAGVELYQDTH
jgi:hypothetical protein